ncbi:RNA recognition domain-containing protein [Loa loa]|uniref:RNA recognition domain-containing protein n=1 Tax=Loa loa TaxID=7209 RepID=A0A1S0U860_LOALO|nr:RNA recognition domain-containing protein [Loa loa]EFO26347.1 RNA recognition domain-containing protein [Loa loa]
MLTSSYICANKERYTNVRSIKILILNKAERIKGWFSPIKLKGIKIVRGLTEFGIREALRRNEFFGGSMLEVTTVSSNRVSDGDVEESGIAKFKRDAGKSHSWNTLFLGANAVAERLAEKLDLLLGHRVLVHV